MVNAEIRALLSKMAFASLLVVVPLVPGTCLAQQSNGTSGCSTTYEDHNQTDHSPLKVTDVRGGTRMQVGDQELPGSPGACLILFSEKGHKLVASIKADEDGTFELKDVAPGRYRLLARVGRFCTANIPIKVVKSSRDRTGILVYFVPAGIDTCSYGEKLLFITTKHSAGAR